MYIIFVVALYSFFVVALCEYLTFNTLTFCTNKGFSFEIQVDMCSRHWITTPLPICRGSIERGKQPGEGYLG